MFLARGELSLEPTANKQCSQRKLPADSGEPGHSGDPATDSLSASGMSQQGPPA